MSSISNRPRVALIGVSGYAVIYLDIAKAAHARGEIELSAAVIINPAEEAAKETELRALGTRIYRDYEEMLRAEAGRLDLCLIPTGIPWHARMTLAALHAGAHVLVEKPLAGSNAEVAAIRAAEKATGKFVAVGFQDIYCPVNRWLKQQLCAGAIGKLHTVRFLGLWPRPAAYFTRNPWAGRLHANGTQVLDSPLNNAFAHFVNLSLYFAGTSVDTSAAVQIDSAELLRAHAIESFDTSVVLARSAEGVNFWFGASHTCHQVREPEIYLEGSAGRVEWKHERSCVIIRHDGSREERVLTDIAANRKALLDAAFEKVHRPDTLICTTALAEKHTAFVEAVHAAAQVQSVPAQLIFWKAPTPSAAPVPGVAGLEEALSRAFIAKSLLRDTGFVLEPARSA
ncbi:Gfo/Idh/MocA family protein [Oleiharenicola lentus]|uniref:Gfo/Idh/MocA family protein n=1 Tax=Oleiharenicola lentus TaxID=2508720 RepID=UPI003F67CD88